MSFLFDAIEAVGRRPDRGGTVVCDEAHRAIKLRLPVRFAHAHFIESRREDARQYRNTTREFAIRHAACQRGHADK